MNERATAAKGPTGASGATPSPRGEGGASGPTEAGEELDAGLYRDASGTVTAVPSELADPPEQE